MTITQYLAKHLRDVYFGGNWTTVNLRDQLQDVNWEEAIRYVEPFNTIAALSYHIHYFVAAILPVLQGNPLDAHDKYSFDHPPIASQVDWEQLQQTLWATVEACTALIEALPETILNEVFCDPRYGTYYRNLAGTIEHAHYHLGQIVVLKKMLKSQR